MKTNRLKHPSLPISNRSRAPWPRRAGQNLIGALCASVLIAAASAGSIRGATTDRVSVVSASASADDGNVAANALDGSFATRWSASGDGQWLRLDLGSVIKVGSVKIAWYKGNQRKARFDIQTSDTGTNWTTAFSGQSSGATTNLESYALTDAAAQYVRIVGHGTSLDLWNSITEVEFFADSQGQVPPARLPGPLSIAAAKTADGQEVTLRWPGTNGLVSQVQASSDFVNWVDVGAPITNTATLLTQQDLISAALPNRFYRLKQSVVSTPPVTTNYPAIVKTYAKLQIDSKAMPYYRNRPIDQYDPRVTRAIIVIHGAGANAEGYFDRVNDIIPSTWGDHMMVIAPYFQDPTVAASGEYAWDGDWREGGASGGISSYAVLDRFVELMRNGNFPNLKWVVVCGHSAGGQTTQRYAAFTDVDLRPWPNAQYMKFVPANPSSYAYLNEFRDPEGDNTWVVPAQDCSSGDGYNEWKYGLSGLYGYTAARGAEWARIHLPARQVELLAGTDDVYDNHGLDTDCGAEWQGPFRYQRAHIFKTFMDKYYPANHFNVTDVPGIGHDSTAMFASSQGMNAIFFPD